MQRIKSFEIDHDDHDIGFYLSSVQGDIYTYDLRFVTPNSGNYIPNPALHSVEHIFATVIRNGRMKDKVIYFGPMGCRTGCYLLLRNVGYDEAKALTIETLEESIKTTEVPGSSKKECGNYLEHDLDGAISAMKKYLNDLRK